ncbi:MAG TPA: glycosyltransferase family A protein [Ramlibacter sp.]|nr:glycosyltransferase family A protein [Ramlibacter sp.]
MTTDQTIPKVSVILPVGNREAYLAEALESILAQTLADFELLVVLDGVPAPVQAIVEAYQDPRIQLIRLPVNLGISAARNAGIAVARAPYIAYMDSDDVALAQRLATQHAWLEAHPEVTVCASNWIKWFANGQRTGTRYPETDGMIKARLLLVDSAIHNPTVMVRSEFLRRHALRFDPNYSRDQSHRLYVEVTRRGGSFYCLQEELLLYRRHPENVTADKSGVDFEKTRVREVLLPMYFPGLDGAEGRLLLKGMCQNVEMGLDEICRFVSVAGKAMNETRSFFGEDRRELQRMLHVFRNRALGSLRAVPK